MNKITQKANNVLVHSDPVVLADITVTHTR